MPATNRQPAWDKIKVGIIPRANIREAIRRHPKASLHVRTGTEIYDLPKAQLLALASKLGINIKARLSDTEYDLTGLTSDETYFPFSGIIEFPITMGISEFTVSRRVRLPYEHSPDWAYLDPRSGEERLGDTAWKFGGLEVETVSETPTGVETSWEECDGLTAPGLWSDEMWQAVEGLIDADCRRQDAERRATMDD
jgi:hypothetical protein